MIFYSTITVLICDPKLVLLLVHVCDVLSILGAKLMHLTVGASDLLTYISFLTPPPTNPPTPVFFSFVLCKLFVWAKYSPIEQVLWLDSLQPALYTVG